MWELGPFSHRERRRKTAGFPAAVASCSNSKPADMLKFSTAHQNPIMAELIPVLGTEVFVIQVSCCCFIRGFLTSLI